MDKLGKYELENLVHEDVRGSVYRARDTSIGRPVLLRLVPKVLTDGRTRSFYRAMQPVLQLEHPNVLAIYEIGEISGQAFVATEPFEGSRLGQIWGDNLTLEARVMISLGALRALLAGHEAGTSHGGLRVDDVLISEDGEIKVENFGLARFEADAQNPADTLPLGQPLFPGTNEERDRDGGLKLIQAMFGSPASGGSDWTDYPVEIAESVEALRNCLCDSSTNLPRLTSLLEQLDRQLKGSRQRVLETLHTGSPALEQILASLTDVEQLIVQEQFGSRVEAISKSGNDTSRAPLSLLQKRSDEIRRLGEEVRGFLEQFRHDQTLTAQAAKMPAGPVQGECVRSQEKARADEIVRSVAEELFEEARSSSTDGQAARCETNLNLILQLDPGNQSARQLLSREPQQPTSRQASGQRRSRLWYLLFLVPVLLVCGVGLGLWKLGRPSPAPIPVQVQAPRVDPVAVWVDQNMKEGLYRFRLRLPEVLDCLSEAEQSGEKGKVAAYREEIRRYYLKRAQDHEAAGNLGLALENYRVLVELLGATGLEAKLVELQSKAEETF